MLETLKKSCVARARKSLNQHRFVLHAEIQQCPDIRTTAIVVHVSARRVLQRTRDHHARQSPPPADEQHRFRTGKRTLVMKSSQSPDGSVKPAQRADLRGREVALENAGYAKGK